MVGGLVDYLLIPLRIGKQGDSCKWNSHAGSVYKPASFTTEANMEENMNFELQTDMKAARILGMKAEIWILHNCVQAIRHAVNEVIEDE
jgi:hypothetical protein